MAIADELPRLLRAVCDMDVADMRELSGRHEYDGVIQDLSPDGVRSGLARLDAASLEAASLEAASLEAASLEAASLEAASFEAASFEAASFDAADSRDRAGLAGARPDGASSEGARLDVAGATASLRSKTGPSVDEAHLAAAAAGLRTRFGTLQQHRWDPIVHLEAMDLSCYDRDYAAKEQRIKARREHAAGWPRAADAAVASLDRVSPVTAAALLPAVRGLAAGIGPDITGRTRDRALAAHARLVTHLERAASGSEAPFALGGAGLTALMSAAGAMPVEPGQLAARAEAERHRLTARLAADCGRIDPDRRPFDLARDLARDHPDRHELLPAARAWASRAISFTRERDLVPYHDGDLRVALAPESRRWARATTVTTAPGEPDNPSWFFVTPPDPSWPPDRAEQWLRGFNAVTLPAMTVNQVAPGHFCRARAARRTRGPVRRTLLSWPTVVGWAHYTEELCAEEGFCAGDPRFAIGVWLSALVRVTRLACTIGLHTGAMTLAEAVRRFEVGTHLTGAAARAEAQRAAFDPMAGRFTWGKLEILAVRERARRQWGVGFTLRRFHTALLGLGSPPLGLLGAALEP